MRRSGAAHSVVWKHHKREIQLGSRARWPKWLEREFTDRKVRGSNPTSALDFPCLGLLNLAVSQPLFNLRVAWQLDTERVLQLNDSNAHCCRVDFHSEKGPSTHNAGSAV
ncbi:hypothetical protein CSKR_104966 [Clonorchis sinensis]|uniref:Uncharacterized protein n=1 Tax=Clonorchis sinensis TaxID=79923 RepID=A0A419Q6Z6_CLOSI|nr:hypothetical protein CSKR_104966 [Clonorchis sinensis]